MALKLLAVGDIHLGRRPSRLPAELTDRARELGPAGAWHRAVETAISDGLDIVALAGDVVEREDDFYEGYRELYAGVTRLKEAGIRVIGVAGNHDVRVLPRLSDQIPDFHLLGRNGEWEPVTIAAGGERLTVWGWSFPLEQVRTSPLAGMTFERHAGPNVGLLHCDRDQPRSVYAPVSSAELNAAGLDGWLLGHIHAPDALDAGDPSGYLGSVTGLDPGEPGAHGPWLLTVERGRLRLEQRVLAPLRWAPLTVDVTDLGEAAAIRPQLLDELRQRDREWLAVAWPPAAVGVRLRLTGRSRLGSELSTLFSEEERDHVFTGEQGTHYFLERVEVATQPPVALETLAEHPDPPGLLAHRLRLLERDPSDPERQALLAAARHRLAPQVRDTRWQALPPETLDEDTVADLLRRAGTRLLERMLAQREASG